MKLKLDTIDKSTVNCNARKALKDGICTCEFIDEPKIYYVGSDKEDFRRCIVKLENLLPYEEEKKPQLNLFS